MSFKIDKQNLSAIIDGKNKKKLEEFDGIEGLARCLNSDLKNGLEGKDFSERRNTFGKNVLHQPEPESFFELLQDGLQDKTLIMLCVASIVSLILGVRENPSTGWIEGVAILSAVIVVVFVGALNNYQKEKQFRALNAKKEDKSVKVFRKGNQIQISTYDLLVGDVLVVETGDILPVDGVFIQGHGIKCDESGNTGESDAISKPEDDPFFLSGSQVLEGYGTIMVVAVGENSLHGRTIASMQVESEDTPLQRKLDKLADDIGKLGIVMSVLTITLLTTKYLLTTEESFNISAFFSTFVKYLITSITMLVVAVPEGLPLAVTISLAYSMKKMLKDNNLVRHLAACETMGGATTICSDKTGTLTQNRMSVVQGTISNIEFKDILSLKSKISSNTLNILFESVSVNSTAYEGVAANNVQEFIGNKTESALLGLNKKLGADYKSIREKCEVVELIPFSSQRKSMAAIIKTETGYRVHVKGASEIVSERCTKKLDADGKVVDITPEDIESSKRYINSLAEQALRTICLAYAETNEKKIWEEFSSSDLIMIGIVGIQDPLRPEVSEAVKSCQRAGIVVRMVTGDNVVTAKNIAKNCGIITPEQINDKNVVMEGPVFRNLDDTEMGEVVPKLRVLARSSPLDKQILVAKLKELGEVVAVTGDGTNDGPALKLAHVGFSMGITGTEIAKEASDIILMDDNFNSIVKAVMWGRNVFDSIRKFLQFQLTVNIVAVSLAFIGSLVSGHGESPLKPVQLLWVNLIMDTMAALALSTEEPTKELLNRKPSGKDSNLITRKMWKSIIGQGIFQLIVNLSILYLAPSFFGIERDSPKHLTIFFNTFVICQVFNEINSRKINDELNVFKGLFSNSIFVSILLFTMVMQYLLVQFGGEFFSTTPLDHYEWLFSIFVGFLGIPVGFVLRLIPINEVEIQKPKPITKVASTAPSAKDKWTKAVSTIKKQNSVVQSLILASKKKKSTQEKWKEAINSVHYQASVVKYLRKDRLKRHVQTIIEENKEEKKKN